MTIGYSYWGYLGDVKYDPKGNIASTPDGNAFYSWSIISELQARGHKVIQMMPNRDKIGFEKRGQRLFSWARVDRLIAYEGMVKDLYDLVIDMQRLTKQQLFNIWDGRGLANMDMVLHEWRMVIPGRNDVIENIDGRKSGWQPDLLIQEALVEYCAKHHITLVIFDLDYKITQKMFAALREKNKDTWLFELGEYWLGIFRTKKVYIPFGFRFINEFKVDKRVMMASYNYNRLVYIGNRYERDWCIDKYIPTELNGVKVYGNWKESGRDSEQRWPNIEFGDRLQTSHMRDVYYRSIATILLAKKEYCNYRFMTARLLEAVFYGTVPLFIEEYGQRTIEEYAGVFYDYLTVCDKSEVIEKVIDLERDPEKQEYIIKYLRERLKFMDVSNFVDTLLSIE